MLERSLETINIIAVGNVIVTLMQQSILNIRHLSYINELANHDMNDISVLFESSIT
jgi:hypothetical protein